jgi:hypothetical protein
MMDGASDGINGARVRPRPEPSSIHGEDEMRCSEGNVMVPPNSHGNGLFRDEFTTKYCTYCDSTILLDRQRNFSCCTCCDAIRPDSVQSRGFGDGFLSSSSTCYTESATSFHHVPITRERQRERERGFEFGTLRYSDMSAKG